MLVVLVGCELPQPPTMEAAAGPGTVTAAATASVGAARGSGYQMCLNFDGGYVTDVGFSTAFDLQPSGLTADIRQAIAADTQALFPWVQVVNGGCAQTALSTNIYLIPSMLPAMTSYLSTVGESSANVAGLGWVNKWGWTGYNEYVFVTAARRSDLATIVAHEAGHAAGLTHPTVPDGSIMAGAYFGASFSASQLSALETRFAG